MAVLGSKPVLISTFLVLVLILAMYKVFGTFIIVPGLNLGPSGLEPNTGIYGDVVSETMCSWILDVYLY